MLVLKGNLGATHHQVRRTKGCKKAGLRISKLQELSASTLKCLCLKRFCAQPTIKREEPKNQNLVDRVECRENHIYLRDFIQFRPIPKLIKNQELARKYLHSNLSSQQLADEYGVSKQMILGRLREAGVHGGKSRGRADGNFRFPNPVYGTKAVEGRLETNPTEMRIARLIVEFRDRQGWSFEKIAADLNQRGHKNRKKSTLVSSHRASRLQKLDR